MPFSDSFRDVYRYGIKGAADDAEAYAERLDEQMFDEGMLDRIFNQISKADLIVADMTGQNPNVFYEVGYAHALGKIVLLITQSSTDIPFDLRHRPHIIYDGSIETLRPQLTEKIKWALLQSNEPIPHSTISLLSLAQRELKISGSLTQFLYEENKILTKSLSIKKPIRGNELIFLKHEGAPGDRILAISDTTATQITPVKYPGPLKDRPKKLAVDDLAITSLLCNPDINVISIATGTNDNPLRLCARQMFSDIFDKKMFQRGVLSRASEETQSENDLFGLDDVPSLRYQHKLRPYWAEYLFDFLKELSDGVVGEWGRAATAELIASRVKVINISEIISRRLRRSVIVIDGCENLTRDNIRSVLRNSTKSNKLILISRLQRVGPKRADTPVRDVFSMIQALRGLAGFAHYTCENLDDEGELHHLLERY